MKNPLLRSASLAALLVHLPAGALSMSPVTVIPRCPPALMALPQEQLVKRLVEQAQPQPSCLPELATLLDENALPFLMALMDHERPSVQLAALHAIDSLDQRAVAAVPVLMARHRRTIAGLARQEAAHGRDGVDQHASSMMAHLSSALGGLQASDPGVTPYLTAVFFDRNNTLDVRAASVAAFWDAAHTSDATRLRIVPELLAGKTTFAAMQGRLASFLAGTGSDVGFTLPAVRARLLDDHEAEMVEPFLAAQGPAPGIALLLQLHASAAPESPLRRTIEEVLWKRRALPGMDKHLGEAAGNPALLPAVLGLINRGVDSPQTFALLASRLDQPSEVERTARIFIGLGRPAPQARARLLALLQATGADDVQRRDLLIATLRASGGQADIPPRLLLDGVEHDMALERRGGPDATVLEPCLPGQVLAQAPPLGSSWWPVLKRTYAAALPSGQSACLRPVVAIIARTGERKALGFLYGQLLSSKSAELSSALLPALTAHVGPLMPRMRRDLGRLRGERLAAVEQLLRGPQASQLLDEYRARVLPGLLTLPWNDAAAQGGPWTGRISPASGRLPCDDLGLALARVERIGPSTPEVTTWLMRLHAGPCNVASQKAWDMLETLKGTQFSQRPLRAREVRALLAATPPGRAQQRLEDLLELFEWTYSDRLTQDIPPEEK